MDNTPIAVIRITFEEISPEIRQLMSLVTLTLIGLNVGMTINFISKCSGHIIACYKQYKLQSESQVEYEPL